jgi:hypothetical protein
MLALTIVPPKPLSSELNAERVLIPGFIVEGLMKGKHLYIGNSPYRFYLIIII